MLYAEVQMPMHCVCLYEEKQDQEVSAYIFKFISDDTKLPVALHSGFIVRSKPIFAYVNCACQAPKLSA